MLAIMTDWEEFTRQAPALAARVQERFVAEKTHVLATLRRDGTPRVSGTEIDFHGRHAYLGSMLGAVKALDLQRDGRFALHAHPAEGGDVKIGGVAVELTDPVEVAGLQGNSEPCHLFRIDLAEAVVTWVEETTIYIDSWREERGTVRYARRDNGPAVLVEPG